MKKFIKTSYFQIIFFIFSIIYFKKFKRYEWLINKNINLILKIKLSKVKYFLRNKDIDNKYFFFWDGDWHKKKIDIRKYNKYNLNYRSVYQLFRKKNKLQKN